MKKLIFSSLGFVLLYNLLFFETDNGVGTGLLFLCLNAFYFLIKGHKIINLRLAITSSVFAVAFGFLIGFRSNEVIQFLNLITATFFSLCALYFYKSDNRFSFENLQFILIPVFVTSNSISSTFSFLSSGKVSIEGKNDPRMSSIMRGLIIAVPLTFILFLLLTHADPVFNRLSQKFFENIWQRIVVSVVVFVGLISFGLTKLKEAYSQNTEVKQNSGKALEVLIVTGSIVCLFAVFIAIQFQYFFSNIGEGELQRLGITSLTYSEYVRKGFFELLAASVISSLVMIYVTKHLHKIDGKQKVWIQAISVTLIFEILLLLLSAGQRINLYQAAHGLTRARVLGFIFLIWLSVILAVIFIRVIKEIKKELIFDVSLYLSVILLLAVNIINIDGLIATKYRPSVNSEIDYFYLTSLSPDGAESWVDALSDAKNTLDKLEIMQDISTENYRQFYWAKSTLYNLNNKFKYLNDKYGELKIDEPVKIDTLRMRKWQSFISGEYSAYQKILENKELFNQLPDLLQKTQLIDSKTSDEVRRNAPLDRATEPPLI